MSKKGKLVPAINFSLKRRGGEGSLAALVQRRASGLSAQDRSRVDALQQRTGDRAIGQLERLRTGLDIEIAPDFSASTASLHGALTALAGGLSRRIAESYPGARISYGIFGGGGAVGHGGSSRILNQQHQNTDGWESTFSKYAAGFCERESTGRQEVVISFHDARPKSNAQLFRAIEAINARGTIVVIAYLPSSGSENADRAMLEDLANPAAGGFEKGVFIDLGGVDHGDSVVMESLLSGLIDAVAKAQRMLGSGKVADTLAVTHLRALVAPIVSGARELTAQRNSGLALEDKNK